MKDFLEYLGMLLAIIIIAVLAFPEETGRSVGRAVHAYNVAVGGE